MNRIISIKSAPERPAENEALVANSLSSTRSPDPSGSSSRRSTAFLRGPRMEQNIDLTLVEERPATESRGKYVVNDNVSGKLKCCVVM